MAVVAHSVMVAGHVVRAWERPGNGPAVVLLHGFPDNRHLYDRLVPCLNPPRRVVTFDFLGWGASDKPAGYRYSADSQLQELDAVITRLGLGSVVLTAHDASGPPAIDWALAHPDRVAALVLLNTYYGTMAGLRPPEAIWLFSTPVVRGVARRVSRLGGGLVFRAMYRWQVGRFFRDAAVRQRYLPLLYRQFETEPTAHRAFFALNEDLRPTLADRALRGADLRAFRRPVRIVFGAADPYLNVRVARGFHELFPGSDLQLLAGAGHFVQMDEPEAVARLILTAAA